MQYLPIILHTRITMLGKFLAGFLAVLFFSYGFFLIGTVSATAERKSLKTEIEDLKSAVATLEIQYYEKAHVIGLGTVTEFGFHTIEPRFVDSTGGTGSSVAIAP